MVWTDRSSLAPLPSRSHDDRRHCQTADVDVVARPVICGDAFIRAWPTTSAIRLRGSARPPRDSAAADAEVRLGQPKEPRRGSRPAVDGNRECCADLTHALVTEPAQTFDERSERHTLDGVEVHH